MAANTAIGEAPVWSIFFLCFDALACVWDASFVSPRPGEPAVVAVLVLAEPGDVAILVEMWAGGAAASWSGLAGAAWLPPDALDPRRSCCVAPQHRPGPFPFLQVCLSLWDWTREAVALLNGTQMVHVFSLQFSDRWQPVPAKHGEDGCQSGVGWAHRASITPTPMHMCSQDNWTSQHRPSSAFQITSP